MGFFTNIKREIQRDVRRKVRGAVKRTVAGDKKKTNVFQKALIKSVTDAICGKKK